MQILKECKAFLNGIKRSVLKKKRKEGDLIMKVLPIFLVNSKWVSKKNMTKKNGISDYN